MPRARILSQADCDRLRELCATMSMRAAAAIVGVQPNTVRDVRRRGWRAGRGAKAPRPRPRGFRARAIAMTSKQLMAHYRVGSPTILRWRREAGLGRHQPEQTCPSLPLPDGSTDALALYGELGERASFERMLVDHGSTFAAERYGVSYGTIRLWRKRMGLPFSWSRQPGAKRDPAQAVPALPPRETLKRARDARAQRVAQIARGAIKAFDRDQRARAAHERAQAY